MITTNTNAPASSGLTLFAMLELIQDVKSSLPIVFYIESEYVPKPNAVYQIPNDQALSGFDLVCHPDHVEAMKAAAGCYLLMPMSEQEWRRRSRKAAAMLQWSGGK